MSKGPRHYHYSMDEYCEECDERRTLVKYFTALGIIALVVLLALFSKYLV